MKKWFFSLLVLGVFMISLVPQSIFPTAANAAGTGIYVNVEDYGANGWDDVEDIDAIQRAIDAVCDPTSAVYGKTLYFPSGTYLVAPAKGRWIVVRDNLSITGDASATIKVKDNAGSFGYLFGAETFDGYVENISLSNIKIDMNGRNNVAAFNSMREGAQYVMFLQAFKNVRFDKINFDTYSGINCLYLSRGGQDCYITNCRFVFERAGNDMEYDNSALYLCNKKQVVTGNIFTADREERATGAIETHYGVSVISGNMIDGFGTGVNVVNPSPSADKWDEENDITVTNNTIHNANSGVQMWACTGHLLSNVTIANNTISLKNADRGSITSFGIEMIYSADLQGDYDNINIIGNTIKFQIEPEYRENIGESTCRGIGICPGANVSNVNVSNNIIQNAPLAGIKCGILNEEYKYENIKIANNMIIDAGIYQFAKVSDYRASIFLLGSLENVYVENNVINDSNDEFAGYNSIYVSPSGTYKNLSIKNNSITAKQGGYYWNVPANNPGIDFGAPFKTFYSDQFPIQKKMTLNAGDIIYNVGTLTPGASYTGYRATAAGTIGTLSDVTGDIAKNTDILVVSDSSNIEPGDYIDVNGVGTGIKVLLVTGNKVKINRKPSADVTGAAVTFKAPVYRAFGQLSRT